MCNLPKNQSPSTVHYLQWTEVLKTTHPGGYIWIFTRLLILQLKLKQFMVIWKHHINKQVIGHMNSSKPADLIRLRPIGYIALWCQSWILHIAAFKCYWKKMFRVPKVSLKGGSNHSWKVIYSCGWNEIFAIFPKILSSETICLNWK